MFNIFIKDSKVKKTNDFQFGTGCLPDERDVRDLKYEDIVGGELKLTDEEWTQGFDVEKELNITIPFKNQGSTLSCNGNAWAYYTAVLNAVEEKQYKEVSAKSIYSQIFLPQGGSYLRDGGKLLFDWGALPETYLTSYDGNNLPSEKFVRELSWKNKKADDTAKVLQAKEYRMVTGITMESIAYAIKNNWGVIGGLNGENNGTWGSNEPKPPVNKIEWGHALYFGKLGVDKLGKFIATPNSWGTRNRKDELHLDDWQKLREDYFTSTYMFNPWVAVDKPNIVSSDLSDDIKKLLISYEKKIIIESEGIGRKGIIINGKLREIKNGREGASCLYTLANNGFGKNSNTKEFDSLPKDVNF